MKLYALEFVIRQFFFVIPNAVIRLFTVRSLDQICFNDSRLESKCSHPGYFGARVSSLDFRLPYIQKINDHTVSPDLS